METPPPPEFGPNGAVLNTPTLGERLRREYLGQPVPPLPGVREHWALRAFHTVMFCAVVHYLTREAPLWTGLPLMLFAVAGFVRRFWPEGPRERVIWFIPGVLSLAPWAYYLLFVS